jgi:hypothetical protein
MKSEITITFIMYSCYDYPPDFIHVTIRAPKHEKRNTTYVQKKDDPLLANLQKKCTVITEICNYPVIDSTVNVISLCAATGLVQVIPSSCKLNVT